MSKLTAAGIYLIVLGMTLCAAGADAKVPDSIVRQKNAVVTVHVDDKKRKARFFRKWLHS